MALSGDRNAPSFAKDDPLAELARIVGDDSRPAVHQLRELERQQERVRAEPAIDLEAELLRELGMFEESVAQLESVRAEMPLPRPANDVVNAPVRTETRIEPAPVAYAAPAQSVPPALAVEPFLSAVEPVRAPEPPRAAAPASSGLDHRVEPRIEPTFSAAPDPMADFDLVDELTQSLGGEPFVAEPVGLPKPMVSSEAPAARAPIADRAVGPAPIAQRPLAEPQVMPEVAVPAHAEPMPHEPHFAMASAEMPVAESRFAAMPDVAEAYDLQPAQPAHVHAAPQAFAAPDERHAAEFAPVEQHEVAPQVPAPAQPRHVAGFAPVPSFVDPVSADALLSDVARFPVPPAAERPLSAPEPTQRKNSFPFTPNFTRATPTMAGQAGGGRSYTRPLNSTPVAQAPVAAPAPIMPVADVPVAAAAPIAAHAPEALDDFEPVIDLDDLALDLSDLDLDLDADPFALADVAPMRDAPVVAPPMPVQRVAESPAVVHPAPVLQVPAAAPAVVRAPLEPVMASMAPAAAPMPVSAPAVAAVEPIPHAPAYERAQPQMAASLPIAPDMAEDDELAFDPAMFAEAEEQVAPIPEFDVPQLPVIESVKPMAHASDYDLDIDAEMAQLFQPAPRAAAPRPASNEPFAQPAFAGEPFARAPVVPVGMADEAFERAMEEDFRRSFAERQAEGRQGFDPLYPEDATTPLEEPRSARKLVLLASAAVVVLVAGGGLAYALLSSKSVGLSSGEPQIILADKSPTKMVPVEKGGKTVPNQDKAVYDRVSGGKEGAPQQDELVSSEEQPMDVVQRTLTPESLPLEGENDMMPDDGSERLVAEDSAADGQTADHPPALPPRKVRTMVVKPDGTLVAREELEEAAPTTVAAADVGASAIRPSLADKAERQAPVGETTSALPGDRAAPALDDEAAMQVAAVEPHVPVPTPAKTAPVKPAASAKPAAAAATPAVKQTTPAAQAAPATAPQETAALAPASAASGGDYVIQVASLPSEADAKASYQKMAAKFGSVLGGRGVDIKKAEIAGKGTYYRVRIPAGSRGDANALCDKLKAAGGSCLVTR
ncbi:hypothetical protein BJF93_10495 [Xaviernesmea oryzae]|uniref:SPOR domain-containing protein n=2 Tax=Xaviernesmea oryzae TaxID=464029 RepID=A0A1Q9AX40_9HYPH|nr:hypothetical protein BJF93_10495 [Xaviernesmea oryzae]